MYILITNIKANSHSLKIKKIVFFKFKAKYLFCFFNLFIFDLFAKKGNRDSIYFRSLKKNLFPSFPLKDFQKK